MGGSGTSLLISNSNIDWGKPNVSKRIEYVRKGNNNNLMLIINKKYSTCITLSSFDYNAKDK